MTKRELYQLLFLLQTFSDETGTDSKHVQDCINNAIDAQNEGLEDEGISQEG